MRRTKEWWGRLTKDERRVLMHIERRHFAAHGITYDKCSHCSERREKLIAKANGQEE